MNQVSGWKATHVLMRRELVRFLRQPARIAAALGTPLLMWVFLINGFSNTLRSESIGDASYAAFLLPGVMTLIAVFTAIFSSISIIEDRQQGWLQAVLVAPAPRWSIALGKTLGGATVAFLQAAILLPMILMTSARPDAASILMSLAALAFTSIAMTAMGVAFAWRSESSAGFHAVMNLVFLPMWLLSGAFFSVRGASPWLGWLMSINPLTWCTHAIRDPLIGDAALAPLAVAGAFAVAMLMIATAVVNRPQKF